MRGLFRSALLAFGLLAGARGNLLHEAVAHAQEGSVRIRVDTTDNVVSPVLQIIGVLDNQTLRNAIGSGIPIRLHTRVELWRDGFFDDLVSSRAWSHVLIYEPMTRQYLLRGPASDGAAFRFDTYDEARAAVEGNRPIQLQPFNPGRYYYSATIVIETLSLSDLEELQRWLRGELQPAVTGDRSIPGALGEGAKRLVIRLLNLPTRRLEARSNRFEVPSFPRPPTDQ